MTLNKNIPLVTSEKYPILEIRSRLGHRNTFFIFWTASHTLISISVLKLFNII